MLSMLVRAGLQLGDRATHALPRLLQRLAEEPANRHFQSPGESFEESHGGLADPSFNSTECLPRVLNMKSKLVYGKMPGFSNFSQLLSIKSRPAHIQFLPH
jgi:hypothetical protein